jgi:GT2 family glycosyltransferase
VSSVVAVIPSWNTAAHLRRCLQALHEQTDVTLELMVVDNGSQDESLRVLEQASTPHVALASNVGFARAVNLGVARTRSPLVLVVNADCFLDRDCAKLLAQALSDEPQLGGAQPRILRDGPARTPAQIYSTGQCLTRSGAAFERGWGEEDGTRFSRRAEVFGVSGAACLLRRELFTQLGGYDESYFAFFEDVDLNARARLAGWRFAYVPEALAFHVGHAAWRQDPSSRRFNAELTVRNRLATAVKVLPARAVARALLLTLRSLAASPFRGTAGAVAKGALTALCWVPRLLAERRRLRAGSARLLDDWLTRTPARGPDPAKM